MLLIADLRWRNWSKLHSSQTSEQKSKYSSLVVVVVQKIQKEAGSFIFNFVLIAGLCVV